MGPPALTGGWGPRRSASQSPRQRFNGAAGSHRRMDQVHNSWWRQHRGASMGPPALTGGWSPSPSLRRASLGGFNGAAGSHRRMDAGGTNGAVTLYMLQWGRRLSPADGPAPRRSSASASRSFNGAAGSHRRMAGCAGAGRVSPPRASMGPPALTGGWRRRRPQSWSRPAASMGPPALTGGWLGIRTDGAAMWVTLQWGRRLSPADGRQRSTSRNTRSRRFNGAAGSHRRMGRRPFESPQR